MLEGQPAQSRLRAGQAPKLSLSADSTSLDERLNTVFECIQNIQLLCEAQGGTLPSARGFPGKDV